MVRFENSYSNCTKHNYFILHYFKVDNGWQTCVPVDAGPPDGRDRAGQVAQPNQVSRGQGSNRNSGNHTGHDQDYSKYLRYS